MTKTARAARRATTVRTAVIYLRVSTDEQLSSGAGLEAQRTECLAYAQRAGLEVLEVVVEGAVSGKVRPADRPGFARALDLLEAADAGVLLVRREDRVSRRLRHLLEVIDLAESSGFALATTDGALDTASADGAFKVHLMGALAERERRVIGERTREALAARKAAGVVLGRPRVLGPEIAARVAALRAGGATFQAIADALNADGLVTTTGAAFTRMSVRKVTVTYADAA